MRNFFKLASGVDTQPLLHALFTQPELWNEITTRTRDFITAHSDVDDILLRFNDAVLLGVKPSEDSLRHQTFMRNMPAIERLPQVRPLIFALMRQVEGEQLGRAMISRLSPGKRILPHTDDVGDYSEFYRRYHIVLQGLPGSIFRCGDEEVQMRTGDVWTFNHILPHEVQNNSADDRLHLVVDIRPCP